MEAPPTFHATRIFSRARNSATFESGSTIVMFASGEFEFSENIIEGSTIRVGEAIFKHPAPISKPIGEDNERFD